MGLSSAVADAPSVELLTLLTLMSCSIYPVSVFDAGALDFQSEKKAVKAGLFIHGGIGKRGRHRHGTTIVEAYLCVAVALHRTHRAAVLAGRVRLTPEGQTRGQVKTAVQRAVQAMEDTHVPEQSLQGDGLTKQ